MFLDKIQHTGLPKKHEYNKQVSKDHINSVF